MKKTLFILLTLVCTTITVNAQLSISNGQNIMAIAGDSIYSGQAVCLLLTGPSINRGKLIRADLFNDLTQAIGIATSTAGDGDTVFYATMGTVEKWPGTLKKGNVYYLQEAAGVIDTFCYDPEICQKIGVAMTDSTFVIDPDDRVDNRAFAYRDSIGSLLGYKAYTALIGQSGASAPSESFVQNSLSGTPTWGYTGAGNYTLTCTGCFTADKTMILTGPMNTWPYESSTCFSLSARWVDVDTIEFKAFRCTDSGNVDDVFNLSIEIRVYP